MELCFFFMEGILLLDLINYHVPSNATQKMYNIQFVLLKLQHVSTVSSGHHQMNKMVEKCSTELQNALPLIWANISNDFTLMTLLAWVKSRYKKTV
jgi:hypothetical protein